MSLSASGLVNQNYYTTRPVKLTHPIQSPLTGAHSKVPSAYKTASDKPLTAPVLDPTRSEINIMSPGAGGTLTSTEKVSDASKKGSTCKDIRHGLPR